jgi:hypothetical protein
MTAYQFTRRPAQAFEIYCCGLPLIGPGDSMKAWVYVAIDQRSIEQPLSNSLKNESAHYNTTFKSFSCTGAVLTRDNSD